jgi:hypothetical protein
MRERSKNKSATEIPDVINGVHAGTGVKPAPDAITTAAVPENNPTVDTDNALKRQIEALRHSEQLVAQHNEQLQRQQLARQAALQDLRPPTGEQKIANWKAHGLSDQEADFLQANPELIDNPELLSYAASQAYAEGLERGTAEHQRATKNHFDTAMRHLKAQAEAREPTPEFFRPPEPPEPPSPASTRSAMVSAPVSRGVPSSDRTLSVPSRVSLSAEERQIAAASGISDQEYARNKILMLRKQRSGEIQT